VWAAALACGLAAAPPAGAGVYDDSIKKLRSDLMTRSFTAKVNLYEAKVDAAGLVMSDPDREEIQKGMPILIERIRIGSYGIRIFMQHPKVHEKTWVEFDLGHRMSEDLGEERAQLEALMALVFDEVRVPPEGPPPPEAPAAGDAPTSGTTAGSESGG
jgi:hypothetical protein